MENISSHENQMENIFIINTIMITMEKLSINELNSTFYEIINKEICDIILSLKDVKVFEFKKKLFNIILN